MTEQLTTFLDTAVVVRHALDHPQTDSVVVNLEAGCCHIFAHGRPAQVEDLPQGLELRQEIAGTFGPWRVERFGERGVVFERVIVPQQVGGEGARGLLARVESELGGHLVARGALLAETALQWIGQQLAQIHSRALILHVGDFPTQTPGVMHLALESDFVPGHDALTRQVERLCSRADVILWASPSDDTNQWVRALGRATVWTTGPAAPYGTWTANLEEDAQGNLLISALSHEVSPLPMEEFLHASEAALNSEADPKEAATGETKEQEVAGEAATGPADDVSLPAGPSAPRTTAEEEEEDESDDQIAPLTAIAQSDYHLQESDDDMRETMEAPESEFRRAMEDFDAVHQRVTSESTATTLGSSLVPALEEEFDDDDDEELFEAEAAGFFDPGDEDDDELPLVEVEPFPMEAPQPLDLERQRQHTDPEIQFVLDSGEFDAFDSDEDFEQSIALDEEPGGLMVDHASEFVPIAPQQGDDPQTREVSEQLIGVLPEDTVDELTLSQEMRAILRDPEHFSINDVFEEISSAVINPADAPSSREPVIPARFGHAYDVDRTPTANVPGDQISEALASFGMLEDEEDDEEDLIRTPGESSALGFGHSSFSSPRVEIERPAMPATLESPAGQETTKQVTRNSVSVPATPKHTVSKSFDTQNPPRLTWGEDEQTAQREMADIHPKLFDAVNKAAANQPEVSDSEGSKLSVLSKRLKALRERRQQLSGEHRAIPRQDND